MQLDQLSTIQKTLLILSLITIVGLFLRSPSQTVISAWRPPNKNSATTASTGFISGFAAPQTGRGLPGDTLAPFGNPLQNVHTVMTQGYGIGSHAPAEIWGGVDLAIDGDGNGDADPQGTEGAPIYSMIEGVARVKPNTWPAGNYLSIENESYKIAFAHLSKYAVQDGEAVKRGQIVGYVGSTGMANGPHLHYEVWHNGQNVSPLDFGTLEP